MTSLPTARTLASHLPSLFQPPTALEMSVQTISLALTFCLLLLSFASIVVAFDNAGLAANSSQEMKTVIEWSRQLRTCDESADRDIPLGTSRIIYAIGDDDPRDDKSVRMHSTMGVKNVNLFDAAATSDEPADTYNITVQSRPFPISPDSDTKPGT